MYSGYVNITNIRYPPPLYDSQKVHRCVRMQ